MGIPPWPCENAGVEHESNIAITAIVNEILCCILVSLLHKFARNLHEKSLAQTNVYSPDGGLKAC